MRAVYIYAENIKRRQTIRARIIASMTYQSRTRHWLTSLILLLIAEATTTHNETEIHVVGLFPLTGEFVDGQGEYWSAAQALPDLSQREDILPGYKIVMHVGDTMVSDFNDYKRKISMVCHLVCHICYIGSRVQQCPPYKLTIYGDGCFTLT